MIEIKKVTFDYPNGHRALSDVSLSIHEGDFVSIMGENGAGKTTLIKHLNGLLKPTSGQVLIDSQNTAKSSVASISRKVGLVFQNPDHQLFSETVSDEVAFALHNFGYDTQAIQLKVKQMLGLLDLTKYSNKSPFSLSGGERKRVALASVMSWDPKYIVLDEPTIGQDYKQKEKLRMLLNQLISQGKSVIMVSHDIEFVAECKPRIILLSKGQVVTEGKTEDILTNEALLDQCSLVMPQITQLISKFEEYGVTEKVTEVYPALLILKKIMKVD